MPRKCLGFPYPISIKTKALIMELDVFCSWDVWSCQQPGTFFQELGDGVLKPLCLKYAEIPSGKPTKNLGNHIF